MSEHSLYDTLGVGKDADPEEVKRAYRRRAKQTHPDAGGKTEEFQAVAAAYQVLADPARRRQYDETGAAGEVVDEEAQVLNLVGNLVFQIIEAVDVAHVDVIDLARQEVKKAIKDTQAQRQQHQKAIAKRERAAKRLLRRKAGANRLGMMLEHEIAKMKAGLAQAAKAIEIRERMLKMLDDYDYKVDVEAPPEPTIQITTWNVR